MASAVIGALRVIFGADTAAFEKGATEVERKLSATQKKLGKLSDKFTSAGKALTLGLTAPLAAFGVSAFKAASDAAEMESAFDVSFGKSAASVRKWAEDTGNAMGRSTQELMSMSASFQDILKKQMDPAAATQLSKNLTVLTQDLASFKNLSNDVAQQKIFSGLIGESEPLRSVGVLLNEQAVQAKAAALGLAMVNGKYTEGAKVQARAALIMEQLKDAQGDVMRTSGSTANEIKRSQAAFEELQVTVGTKLLPAITPLIEKLGAAVEWFTRLPQPIQNVALGVGAISAALGPALLGFSGTIKAFGTLLPLMKALGPVITVVRTAMLGLLANPILLGAAAVITGIYLAWKHWDEISAIVQRVYTAVKTWLMDKLGPVIKWVGDKVKGLIEPFRLLWDKVVGHSYIPDMVNAIGQHMARLDALMVQPAVAATNATAQAFQALQQRVSGILNRLFPEQAAFNQLKRDIDDLAAYAKQAGWSPQQLDEAITRARRDYYDSLPAPKQGPFDVVPQIGSTGSDIAQQAADAAEMATSRLKEAHGVFGDFSQLRAVVSQLGLLGGRTFGGIADTILNQMVPAIQSANGELQNMGMQTTALQGLFSSLFSAIFGKKTGGVLGNIAGALVGGLTGRAVGGHVNAGQPYIVGEMGREAFIPASAGTIVPNHALRSGGGERPIVFDLRGAVMTEDLLRQMNAMADGAAIRGATGGAALAHKQAARAANRRLG